MGDQASKFENRAEFIDDFNTVNINFIGGDGYKNLPKYVQCPADRIVLEYTKGIDPNDQYKIDPETLKATSEIEMKNAFQTIIKNLEFKQGQLKREF